MIKKAPLTPEQEYDYYAEPDNQQPQGPPRRRQSRLSEMVPVRFPPELLAEIRRHAEADDRSLSSWIRRAAEHEIRTASPGRWRWRSSWGMTRLRRQHCLPPLSAECHEGIRCPKTGRGVKVSRAGEGATRGRPGIARRLGTPVGRGVDLLIKQATAGAADRPLFHRTAAVRCGGNSDAPPTAAESPTWHVARGRWPGRRRC